MRCPRITQAKAVDDNTLIIHFSNKEVKQYNIQQLFSKEMFVPLKQPAFFKNFTIEPGGYALVWNEDIDISEYELWKNSTAITGETQKTQQRIESYAQEADDAKFDAILARVPDVPPIEGDERL